MEFSTSARGEGVPRRMAAGKSALALGEGTIGGYGLGYAGTHVAHANHG